MNPSGSDLKFGFSESESSSDEIVYNEEFLPDVIRRRNLLGQPLVLSNERTEEKNTASCSTNDGASTSRYPEDEDDLLKAQLLSLEAEFAVFQTTAASQREPDADTTIELDEVPRVIKVLKNIVNKYIERLSELAVDNKFSIRYVELLDSFRSKLEYFLKRFKYYNSEKYLRHVLFQDLVKNFKISLSTAIKLIAHYYAFIITQYLSILTELTRNKDFRDPLIIKVLDLIKNCGGVDQIAEKIKPRSVKGEYDTDSFKYVKVDLSDEVIIERLNILFADRKELNKGQERQVKQSTPNKEPIAIDEKICSGRNKSVEKETSSKIFVSKNSEKKTKEENPGSVETKPSNKRKRRKKLKKPTKNNSIVPATDKMGQNSSNIPETKIVLPSDVVGQNSNNIPEAKLILATDDVEQNSDESPETKMVSVVDDVRQSSSISEAEIVLASYNMEANSNKIPEDEVDSASDDVGQNSFEILEIKMLLGTDDVGEYGCEISETKIVLATDEGENSSKIPDMVLPTGDTKEYSSETPRTEMVLAIDDLGEKSSKIQETKVVLATDNVGETSTRIEETKMVPAIDDMKKKKKKKKMKESAKNNSEIPETRIVPAMSDKGQNRSKIPEDKIVLATDDVDRNISEIPETEIIVATVVVENSSNIQENIMVLDTDDLEDNSSEIPEIIMVVPTDDVGENSSKIPETEMVLATGDIGKNSSEIPRTKMVLPTDDVGETSSTIPESDMVLPTDDNGRNSSEIPETKMVLPTDNVEEDISKLPETKMVSAIDDVKKKRKKKIKKSSINNSEIPETPIVPAVSDVTQSSSKFPEAKIALAIADVGESNSEIPETKIFSASSDVGQKSTDIPGSEMVSATDDMGENSSKILETKMALATDNVEATSIKIAETKMVPAIDDMEKKKKKKKMKKSAENNSEISETRIVPAAGDRIQNSSKISEADIAFARDDVRENSSKIPDNKMVLTAVDVGEKSCKIPENKIVLAAGDENSSEIPEYKMVLAAGDMGENSNKIPENKMVLAAGDLGENSSKIPENEMVLAADDVEENSSKIPENKMVLAAGDVGVNSSKIPANKMVLAASDLGENSSKIPENKMVLTTVDVGQSSSDIHETEMLSATDDVGQNSSEISKTKIVLATDDTGEINSKISETKMVLATDDVGQNSGGIPETKEVVAMDNEQTEPIELKLSNHYSNYNLSTINFGQLSEYQAAIFEIDPIINFADFSIIKIIILLNTMQFSIANYEARDSFAAFECFKDCLKILHHTIALNDLMVKEFSEKKSTKFEEYFLPALNLCQSQLYAFVFSQSVKFIQSSMSRIDDDKERLNSEFIHLIESFSTPEEMCDKLRHRNNDIYTELAKQVCIVLPLSYINTSNEDIIENIESIKKCSKNIEKAKIEVTGHNLKLPSAFGPPKYTEYHYLNINIELVQKLLELQHTINSYNWNPPFCYLESADLREFCITLQKFEEFQEREVKPGSFVHSFLYSIDKILDKHIFRILISHFYSFIFHILLSHLTRSYVVGSKTDSKSIRHIILDLLTSLCPIYQIPEKLCFRNDKVFKRYIEKLFNTTAFDVPDSSEVICLSISKILKENKVYLEKFHVKYFSKPSFIKKQIPMLKRNIFFKDDVFNIHIQGNETDELIHFRQLAKNIMQAKLS